MRERDGEREREKESESERVFVCVPVRDRDRGGRKKKHDRVSYAKSVCMGCTRHLGRRIKRTGEPSLENMAGIEGKVACIARFKSAPMPRYVRRNFSRS